MLEPLGALPNQPSPEWPRIAVMGAGAVGCYFGELALIDDQPRSGSARAAETSSLLILYKSDFDDLIEGHRAIAIKVMSNLLKALARYVRVGPSRGTSRSPVIAGAVPATGKPGNRMTGD